MNGLMMQQPLLISSLLVHAERHHGEQLVVSRRVEGDIHRIGYRELAARSRRMANALAALDVKPGARVATLAWNGHRHMELYYAVSGSGAVRPNRRATSVTEAPSSTSHTARYRCSPTRSS